MFRFLLVSLAIDTILDEVTVLERKRKLDEMTRGNHLGDVYGTTLERIKAQKGRSRLGIGALIWVSNSERPLRTSELCHALGVRIGSTDLDLEGVPTIRTLIGCSLGLITVEASSSIVRLVHFTLQEYLSNNSSLFRSPHSMMAEVCLTYLNFRCVQELSPTLLSAPPIVPFVEYASCYWGRHMGKEKAKRATQLALLLLVGYEEHIASRLLLLHYHEYDDDWDDPDDERFTPKGFTGLHGAAFHGIGEIVPALLSSKEWSINERDNLGRTALSWAAAEGHEDVVKQLLQLEDIDPNVVDTEYGRTPLWWAAERGHEGVVRMLLERADINLNPADTEHGRTPLWWAAARAHEGIVRMLLERESVNPNTADTQDGRTPLLWATERGHEGIVKLLLQQEDIDPNTPDSGYGQTPLLRAAQLGYEGIVKLLLERKDLTPNIPDPSGETALDLAASHEHTGIVQLLSQPRPSLPIPIDNPKAPTIGQGNPQNNSKKRTIHPSDDGSQRKKHRGAPT